MVHMRGRRLLTAVAATALLGAGLSAPALAESSAQDFDECYSVSNLQVSAVKQSKKRGRYVSLTWDEPECGWAWDKYRVIRTDDYRPQRFIQIVTGKDSAIASGLKQGRVYTFRVQVGDEDAFDQEPLEVSVRIPGPSTDAWVVSLGDSFISGEGGRWAGNADVLDGRSAIDFGSRSYADQQDGEVIDGCHRSRSAVVNIGTARSMNLACSGAITRSQVLGDTYPWLDDMWKPGIDFEDWTNAPTLPAEHVIGPAVGQAQLLKDFARGKNVEMVMLSIGGNNFGFGAIVSACVTSYISPVDFDGRTGCRTKPELLEKLNEAGVARTQREIVVAIGNIVRAMEESGHPLGTWTLGYQMYPRPLPDSTDMRYPEYELNPVTGSVDYPRQDTGGCGLWDADIDWALNTAVPTINNTLLAAGLDAVIQHPGLNIVYMDTTNAFRGHELCSKGVYRVNSSNAEDRRGVKNFRQKGASDKSEWVKEIDLINFSDATVEESFHPNYWGQMAMRNCWRQLWNGGNVVSGGRCEPLSGLNKYGEPNMAFTPDAALSLFG